MKKKVITREIAYEANSALRYLEEENLTEASLDYNNQQHKHARRPNAYQLAWANGCPHQFLSVPILATPVIAFNDAGGTKLKNSFHIGAR